MDREKGDVGQRVQGWPARRSISWRKSIGKQAEAQPLAAEGAVCSSPTPLGSEAQGFNPYRVLFWEQEKYLIPVGLELGAPLLCR